MTHTPGPWHVGGKGNLCIYGEKGWHVADTLNYHASHPKEAAAANARLIAEAPAMLDALRDSTNDLEEWLEWALVNKQIDRRSIVMHRKRIAENRAILARIEGKAS